ncbi:IS701 family transposase [Streptomyces sp. NPDC048337]|uniref:IS701 family transposase n=1 Tax=Streptomyces sp. NPDC048337 TaxID=3365535 RepID=UPI00371C48BA
MQIQSAMQMQAQIQAEWLAPSDVTPEQRAAEEWGERFDELLEEVGSQFFSRSDLRHHAQEYVRSLLGGITRSDSILPAATESGAGAFWVQQHLLGRSIWDADTLRDFTTRYVVEGLADGCGPGVLVLDETAFRKKGSASAGVARQYSEALGGAVSCQIGVMASWSTQSGTALVDRELYLPPDWDADPVRRRNAHIPDDVRHASKADLARRIVQRFRAQAPRGAAAGMWVVADAQLGCDQAFCAFLLAQGIPHVVGVPPDHPVLPHPGWRRVSRLVQRYAEAEDWDRLAVGSDAVDTGPWEWWVRRIPSEPVPNAPTPEQAAARPGGGMARWLVACRRSGDPQSQRYFIARGPVHISLDDLAAVVAAWRHGRNALAGAGERCGLGAYRVRSWHGWYRHITLAQLAAGFLAVQAGGHSYGGGTPWEPAPAVRL